MSCRSRKLLFIRRVFVATGSERRLRLHSRGLVGNGTECLGVVLLWQTTIGLDTARCPLENVTYLLVGYTFATRSEIAWVGSSFVKLILAHED
jgi:hypothetical protein